jgi:hypothetical protein
MTIKIIYHMHRHVHRAVHHKLQISFDKSVKSQKSKLKLLLENSFLGLFLTLQPVQHKLKRQKVKIITKRVALLLRSAKCKDFSLKEETGRAVGTGAWPVAWRGWRWRLLLF